ncbi:MAG: ethylbenzene dehydrogenase-related protein [Promethearchaeota archaeon]
MSNMKNRKFTFFFIAIMGISTILFLTNISLVGAQTPNLVATKVTGAITVDGMDNEAFWADATSQTFSLTATPGSDPTPANQHSVTMKAVVTDTKVRLFFSWTDPTENNTITGHEDRLSVMILIEGLNDMESPCMNTSTNGATTSGTADHWHWKAARTDSGGEKYIVVPRRGVAYNTGDTAGSYNGLPIPAHRAIYYDENSTSSGWDLSDMGASVGDTVYYVDSAVGKWRWSHSGNGSAIALNVMSHDFSFAENEYLDEESRKRSGDSEYTAFGVHPSPLSGEERYFIEAKGYHDGSGWSLEVERDLAVTNAVIDKAMAIGDTIKFAISVYDGAYDHDHEFKYITSAWKTLKLASVGGGTTIPGFSIIIVGLASIGTIGIIAIFMRRRK